MESWGVVFLGLIALSSLVQAAFLIGVARGGQRLARRLDELQRRLDHELSPALQNLTRVTRGVAELTDLAVVQGRRLDDLIADTVEKIEETTGLIQRVVVRPLAPLIDIVAFLKGVRRGLDVYHQLRGFDRRARASRYDDAEDEHMFI